MSKKIGGGDLGGLVVSYCLTYCVLAADTIYLKISLALQFGKRGLK